MDPFTSIPPEILSHICLHLSTLDILSIRKASKLLYKLSFDNDIWKHQFESTFGQNIECQDWVVGYMTFRLESIGLGLDGKIIWGINNKCTVFVENLISNNLDKLEIMYRHKLIKLNIENKNKELLIIKLNPLDNWSVVDENDRVNAFMLLNASFVECEDEIRVINAKRDYIVNLMKIIAKR
jgi:hypothetical protein